MRRFLALASVFACAAVMSTAPAQAFYQIDPVPKKPLVVNNYRSMAVSPIKRETVAAPGKYTAGTIVVNTPERRLYLVQPDGTALKYGIGVGKDGFQWSGTHRVTNKREWPDWRPPAAMLKRRPDLPRHMEGGPNNPLGARALYLGSTIFRIHGSNEPHTIGHAVSSGCFRMTIEDVADLYERVPVGTKVVVIR